MSASAITTSHRLKVEELRATCDPATLIGQERALDATAFGTRKGSAMVQAIRDQWAVIVAVIALVGLVVWLWRTRSKASR